MPKKLSITKLWKLKHRSTGRRMRIIINKNSVILVKGRFIYKIRKENGKYVKVRKDGNKEIVYDLTKTELKKFKNKLDKLQFLSPNSQNI